MMASKEKAEIEKAVGIMMDMLKAEPDYIPAIYVMNQVSSILTQCRVHLLGLCFSSNHLALEISSKESAKWSGQREQERTLKNAGSY